MARIPILGAVGVSLVLIFGALWFRFAPEIAKEVGLEAVPQKIGGLESADYAALASSTISTEPLNSSDIIGRQLFADYSALKSSNSINSRNLSLLAEKYAETTASINLSAEKINASRIQVVNDSKESIATYNTALNQIRLKYRNRLVAQYEKLFGKASHEVCKEAVQDLTCPVK